MNIQRAKEIAKSPSMAKVFYEGVPIYIQNVDEGNEVARIFPLEHPEQEQEVPLNNLEER